MQQCHQQPNVNRSFYLSTVQYDPSFSSKYYNSVDLVSSARNVLKFLLKVREEGIIFKNYEKSRLGIIIQYQN
jgi:hypothetical protein